MRLLQVYVDPPRITALTLPARCRDLAPAVDMDRKATVIDGQTDGRTNGRTFDRHIDPAPHTVQVASITVNQVGKNLRFKDKRFF